MSNIVHHDFKVSKYDREKLHQHKAFLIWFTGLSGSGKSTIANALESKLNSLNVSTYALDGDNIRFGICKDLTFSPEDRTENIRRIAEIANLFVDAGIVTLASFISPYSKDRQNVRNTVGPKNYIEVFVNASLFECERRDEKGLYKKSSRGVIKNMTGISAPYETPQNPDLEIDTVKESVEESVDKVFKYLEKDCMSNYIITHLRELESEAIFIIREIAAQFENPVLLFSGGKDSILLTHLAKKAFYPAKIPFPLVHIDTGHNFPETIEFRDSLVKKLGVRLIIGSVQEDIDKGRAKEETGVDASRNSLQIVSLLYTLEEHKVDAAMGGARRDEEKARAKERFFSHRDEFGHWDQKNQRPELWNLFNGRKHYGEHFRVFPISNWTEMDVWEYIKLENIELPSLYFSHQRECVIRDGVIWLIQSILN